MVDNEKYIKEAEAIEGGFLDLGFEKYLVRLEIVGQEDGPTIIRSTIEYKVDAEHASNASLVSTGALATIADAITKYIKEQKNPKQAAEQTSEEQAPRLSQPKEKKGKRKKIAPGPTCQPLPSLLSVFRSARRGTRRPSPASILVPHAGNPRVPCRLFTLLLASPYPRPTGPRSPSNPSPLPPLLPSP